MIPAVFLCAFLSGCADQPSTAPKIERVAQVNNVSINKYFVAWSQGFSSSPIQTQQFALDVRQERQYGGYYADQNVLAFARANPGRLYINGDEPDQFCVTPYDYAAFYHDFVTAVRAVDPTARFSPAGFAEPNDYCCPPGDEACQVRMHSTSYAEQFYNAYIQRYGMPPKVDEWRFHDFGMPFAVGDVNGWYARVQKHAAWSVAHGAKMVLGAWGFLRWAEEPPAAYQEHLKQAMGLLLNDKRIVGATYWSYEPWVASPLYLVNTDGSLTPAGQTYANPLSDVPTGVKIIGSTNGQARLRWNNTTSAWAVEAEFWVQAPGSSAFVYHSRELVAGPGPKQTPLVGLNTGGRVKGRVRYHNDYGQAAWSPFSNVIAMGSSEKEGDPRRVFPNSPVFCFMRSCN